MVNPKSKQILLTQFSPSGTIEKGKIRLNAIKVEVIDLKKLYLSKIEGDFSNPEVHPSHIIRRVNIKHNFACVSFNRKESSDSHIWVLSVEQLNRYSFKDSGSQFKIVPISNQVELNPENLHDRESIRELIYNEVQQEFANMGYLKPGNVRTSSKRHSKGFMLKIDSSVDSIKDGLYWYHGFNGIRIRVKHWRRNKFLIALDTLLPIMKTTYPAEAGYQTMIDNNGWWPSTKKLPELVSKKFLFLRKKNAKKRLRRDLDLLNQLSFSQLGIRKVGDFETIKYKYLEEPTFLFGSGYSEQISEKKILSEFIAPRLKDHGPYFQIKKPIRVQPIIMKQLEEEFGTDKILKALDELKEIYRLLFRQDLVINDLITLKETEDQVESQCKLLSKMWPKNYDIIVGFLKGKKYNHPFRSAIKRGLQKVPSQIIKYYNLNSIKMFKDIMSHSILSQFNYKITGKLMTPVDPDNLKEFQVRIYYDLGHFRLTYQNKTLGPKAVAIVGTAALVTDQGVYGFQAVSQINDVNQIEVPSRNIIRNIITEVINKYLQATGKKKIEGNILIQRDGKAHKDEFYEAEEVIEYFRDSENQIISKDCNWVFVEFNKRPVIRLFSHFPDLEPRRGTYFPINEEDIYLTTTGFPDIHAKASKKKEKKEAVGVAVSLEIRRLAEGGPKRINMIIIARDVYYRSFMWMASFQKSRHIAEANMVHELFDLRRQGVNDPPEWIC